MKIRFALLLLVVSLAPGASADERLAALGALISHGQPAEARTKLEAAREEYAKQGDVRREGMSLMLLFMATVVLNDQDAARRHVDQAVEKLAASGDYLGAWMGCVYAGARDRADGNATKAVERQTAALQFLRQAEAADAFSVETVLLLGPMMNMDLGPMGSFMSSPMMKPIMLRLAEMMARDELGAAYMDVGQLEQAEVELTRAQDLSGFFIGAFDSSIARHLGHLRRRQWKLEEAIASYRKALAAADRLPGLPTGERPDKLWALENLAETEALRGDVDAALAWNDQARELVRALGKPGREADVLEKRAGLLNQASRYVDAQRVLEEALNLATASGDAARQASLLTGIASSEFFRGDYGKAQASFERAIDAYHKVKDPLGETHVWMMLAELYQVVGAMDNARLAIAKAREHAKNVPLDFIRDMVEVIALTIESPDGPPAALESLARLAAHPQLGDLLLASQIDVMASNVAALHTGMEPQYSERAKRTRMPPSLAEMTAFTEAGTRIRRGDTADARALLLKRLEAASTNESRFGLQGLIAVSYTKEGNAGAASEWYRKAIAALEQPLEQMQDDEMLSSYLGTGRRWFYDLAIETLLHQGKAAEAFDYSERARARAFLQLIGHHRLSAGRGANERLVREAEALRKQISAWEQSGRNVPELDGARREYRSLNARVKTSKPEYASLTRIEPASVDTIRKDLPPGTTLVSYFVSVQGLHAWILSNETLHHVDLTGDRAAQQRALCWAVRFGAVPQAGAQSARGTERRPRRCSEIGTAEDAYDMLIAPLREKIRDERLIIVPHGALHYIPFAALRNRKTRRYLVQDYTITLAPSASALHFLRGKETPVDGGSLVLGNPEARLGALPGAEREAVTVAAMLGTKPMLGAAATENLVHQLGGKVDLLHIGAHGRYDDAAPTFSRIALAPGDGHDGNLEVHEILSGLDLTGVNLVVLSACQTAVGERSGGDDIVGLTRAILYAGSPGVISTLWNIDDKAAPVLMEELYKQLLRGKPAADALRAAQLALLEHADFHDPRYWAAFTLTGNPEGRWKAMSSTSPDPHRIVHHLFGWSPEEPQAFSPLRQTRMQHYPLIGTHSTTVQRRSELVSGQEYRDPSGQRPAHAGQRRSRQSPICTRESAVRGRRTT